MTQIQAVLALTSGADNDGLDEEQLNKVTGGSSSMVITKIVDVPSPVLFVGPAAGKLGYVSASISGGT